MSYDKNVIRARAIDYSSQGIVITDLNQEDNPIVDVNTAFTAMTGYHKKDIIGKNCRFLQGPDRDQDEVVRLHVAINERKDVTVTLKNYRKDGTMFWNELTVSIVYDDDDRPIYCIGVQQDVTEQRKMLEDILESKNQLERLNAVMVNRELKMVQLKAELAALKKPD